LFVNKELTPALVVSSPGVDLTAGNGNFFLSGRAATAICWWQRGEKPRDDLWDNGRVESLSAHWWKKGR